MYVYPMQLGYASMAGFLSTMVRARTAAASLIRKSQASAFEWGYYVTEHWRRGAHTYISVRSSYSSDYGTAAFLFSLFGSPIPNRWWQQQWRSPAAALGICFLIYASRTASVGRVAMTDNELLFVFVLSRKDSVVNVISSAQTSI